jgi:hypothetical protein
VAEKSKQGCIEEASEEIRGISWKSITEHRKTNKELLLGFEQSDLICFERIVLASMLRIDMGSCSNPDKNDIKFLVEC